MRREKIITKRADNSVSMPMLKQAVESDEDGVKDTQEYFKEENVSLGYGNVYFPL